MPINQSGFWVPFASPKQMSVLETCRLGAHRYVLLSGPRLSTKTLCCLNLVADHAWRTDRGNICIVTITQTAGMDSGVWSDLEVILQQWIDGDFGMKWVKRPYIANVTKKPMCEVSNKFGNKTKIQLDSLRNEGEVEARFKGKRYTMLFVNELSNFKQRKTFDTWAECLRSLHLKDHQHLFLADTNPADEGTKSWIYDLWYRYRVSETESEQAAVFQKQLALVEWTISDNTFSSKNRIEEVRARYLHNPDLYARYWEGKWVTATANALFADVFKPAIHVIGERESAENPDPLILAPEKNCVSLLTGWDLGGRNSAAAIIEQTTRVKEGGSEESVFKVLDELVLIDQDFKWEDFCEEMVQKMEYWEKIIGKRVAWKHWSDRSAFDYREPISHLYHHQLVCQATDGRITLMAADRSRGSVRARIDLFRKLLFEDRIYFSAEKCQGAIEMCQSIRRGKTASQSVELQSEHKHVFDAITYSVASESFFELEQNISLTLTHESGKSVNVAL